MTTQTARDAYYAAYDAYEDAAYDAYLVASDATRAATDVAYDAYVAARVAYRAARATYDA